MSELKKLPISDSGGCPNSYEAINQCILPKIGGVRIQMVSEYIW